tara:strand:- start:423 stop:641 length:219 start_codon:yes stop_codon:yes gene_type:complete
MYDLLSNILWYIGLSNGPTVEEDEANKYVSITKYCELEHPVKCQGSYVNSYKAKNYHYHFSQTITQPNQNLK